MDLDSRRLPRAVKKYFSNRSAAVNGTLLRYLQVSISFIMAEALLISRNG